MTKMHVQTSINGESVEFLCSPQQTLLEALREIVGKQGTKEGCGTGDCGACSVLIDDRLVCSCLVFAAEAEGVEVTTIEGIADDGTLHPLQEKFLEHAALQCGICTPASSWPPSRSWTATRIRTKKRSGTGWPATCAAARVTTRSSGPCRMRPDKWLIRPDGAVPRRDRQVVSGCKLDTSIREREDKTNRKTN